MKYLKLYENGSNYNPENLQSPWVVYLKDEDEVHYSYKESSDILYVELESAVFTKNAEWSNGNVIVSGDSVRVENENLIY